MLLHEAAYLLQAVYQFAQYHFLGSALNVVHLRYPEHLIGFLELFGHSLCCRHLAYQLLHSLLCLLLDRQQVSGRTYHIKYNPPKIEGKDDVTGDPLIQRDDDREEVVRKRLDVYHSQTEALVGFYSDLAKSGDKTAPQYRAISGLGAIDAITARVFEALK